MTGTPDPWRAAEQAAGQAGVAVRGLVELADLRAVCQLFDRIWRPDPTDPPITAATLRAMVHAGNYAAGAVRGGELVGACVGFFAAPVGAALHSHVAGVAPGHRSAGVGLALKLHQRAWALARGLTEVTWTFDPLVRRNAHFNLTRLGARPREYLIDFYGALDDELNAGQGSDRLLVGWDLTAALPADPGSLASDSPLPAGAELVEIPPDIEALVRSSPARAQAWRQAVREQLGAAMAGGAVVTGFADALGGYVIERKR